MLRLVISIGVLVALVVIPLTAVGQVETGEATFIPLGDLPGGQAVSSALGVAVVDFVPDEAIAAELDDGKADEGAVLRVASDDPDHELEALIVGDSSSAETGSNAREAFAWTEQEGMIGLGSLKGGSFRSRARAISDDGKAIVGASSSAFTGSNSAEAFLLDERGAATLGDLPGGQYRSEAFDVSHRGDYVVGSSSSRGSGANSSEAFRWSDKDGMMGLGSLEGGQFRSAALGISDDGGLVVGWSSSRRSGANSSEAFRWSEGGGMLGLGSLAGGQFSSEARDVSSHGSVIVGASSSARSGSNATEAFIWNEKSGMAGLGFLPGGFSDSEANAVTGDGGLVVGRSRTPSLNDAFIWDDVNGMRSIIEVLESAGLDLEGWRLVSATGVVRAPDAIVVVGTGINPREIEEAWAATLAVPEPSATAGQLAALLAVAALAGRSARCRRRT